MTLDLSSLSSGIRPKDFESKLSSDQTSHRGSLAQEDVNSTTNKGDESAGHLTSEAGEQIQILDLCSDNPIISHQRQLYSCEWTSPLGTDVILKPDLPDGEQGIYNQYSQKDHPILALSQLRLTAQPVRPNIYIKDKTGRPHDGALPSNVPAPVIPMDTSQPSRIATTPRPVAATPPVATNGLWIQGEWVPVSDQAKPQRRNQARFLSRIDAAKKARGEDDKITVYAQKRLTGAGWRSQRREEEEADKEGGEELDDEGEVGVDNRQATMPVHEHGSPGAPRTTAEPQPSIEKTPRPGYSIHGRKIGRPRKSTVIDDRYGKNFTPKAHSYREGAAKKKRVPGRGTRGRRRTTGSIGAARVDDEDEEDEDEDMLDDRGNGDVGDRGNVQVNNSNLAGQGAVDSSTNVSVAEDHVMEDV